MRALSSITTVFLLAFSGCIGSDLEGDQGAGTKTPAPGEPQQDEPRAFGDSRILGSATDRFHLEGVAYHDGVVYASTAFGALGDPVPVANFDKPSRIYAWNRTSGELIHTIMLQGEDVRRSHGAIGIKTDAEGRLYVLSSQLGLLRFTLDNATWTQENLGMIPDIRPCLLAAPPCSATPDDEPPIGNDLTWGPDGALYVSDSFQASVWRLAPGGKFELWFTHADLDRKFGPNGLRVSPDGTLMYLAITGPDGGAVGPVHHGSKVFTIPFPDPKAGAMKEVLALPNGDAADGIEFGARGDLYVLSNFGDRIFIIENGTGKQKIISNADLKGKGRMDFPASIAWDGAGAALIANYAYGTGVLPTGERTLIDVFLDDVGFPEPKPWGFEVAHASK